MPRAFLQPFALLAALLVPRDLAAEDTPWATSSVGPGDGLTSAGGHGRDAALSPDPVAGSSLAGR